MALTKPFKRIIRPSLNTNQEYFSAPNFSGDYYITHSDYAPNQNDLVRSFLLLIEDLKRTFRYIEPSDDNLKTYSHDLYSLFLRACTEFETNCKSILNDNGYGIGKNLTIEDYYKLNKAMRLDEYSVCIKDWRGGEKYLNPFNNWGVALVGAEKFKPLAWYQDYNNVKHNRDKCFEKANLENVLNAIGGVCCILAAQIHINAFGDDCVDAPISSTNNGYHFHPFYDCLFGVRFPEKSIWSDCDKYDFDWDNLKNDKEPFVNYSF